MESYYFTFGNMSKIGYKNIQVTDAVQVEVTKEIVNVKGPKGQISLEIPKLINVKKEENTIIVGRENERGDVKALHGLFRSLIANAVHGVEKGWEKRLHVVGTGYNVKLQGQDLAFKLGYSHPVVFNKVEGIEYKVEGNNKVVVTGSDKQLVGQIAYQIKSLKKPDAYKGKGIRYEDEVVRLKPGKKAKA